MIRVYADDALIYAPLLEGYELLGLEATTSNEKGGTAEIILPPEHPAYNAFISLRTIIEIYRHDRLLFRGRALNPATNMLNQRTITCEGERCFFRDSAMRPYLYQTDPASIFADLVAIHNAQQTDPRKRFVVGQVTVTDPNGYLRMEDQSAGQVSDAMDKLVEAEGGYITFSGDSSGPRYINWLAEMPYRSQQAIEFGENLLDFTSSGVNADLITAILPYGAKDETTGERVTIESVNGGSDYIQDDEAVALRGFIMRPVFWDDVTEPANLLTKARAYLNTAKLAVTALELSAVDLSAVDRDIDTFQVGDWVRVVSKPHGVNDYFLLRQRTYNLLDPSQDRVAFGKELATLTGSDVAAYKSNAAQIKQAQTGVQATVDRSNAALKQELSGIYGAKVNTSGQYMTADGLLLQWGTVEGSAPDVAFAYMYETAPVVLATACTAGASVAVEQSTTTGATLRSTATGPINWLAIGNAAPTT